MPRTPLDAALQTVADLYTSAGLRVALDPQDVNPPCVYVTLRQLDPSTLSGDTYTAEWDVLLIAPAAGQLAALRVLSELEQTAAAAIPPTGSTTAVNYVSAAGPDPLPALLLPISTLVTPD